MLFKFYHSHINTYDIIVDILKLFLNFSHKYCC